LRTPEERIEENPAILLYTRIRKSPFFYASRKHGPKRYSVYNHRYHPRHYGDPVQEYWHLVNNVTLWDVGVEVQVQIKGPDAFRLANLMVPRDLHKCPPGQCKYVFILAPDGGILNDPVLLRVDEDEFWLSLADSDANLYALGLATGLGLDVTVREIDVAPVQIQGPNAGKVMAELFGPSILDLPYYHLTHRELDGMKVVVSRTGYTGEVGFEIYVHEASRNGEKLWDTVLEAGRPFGLEVIGPSHIRRIEAGILAFGADMWYDNNPFEVGYHYTWMVDLDQEEDFIGKAALKRIKEEGVKRKLVGVDIGGDPLGTYIDNEMVDFFPVFVDGREVGKVTSACYSPRLEKNIGYAMLPVEFTELGTELEVDTPRSGRVPAVVVPLPHWDPAKQIPKQDLRAEAGGKAG
jgi:glycine cleavage system aminomethyltransferase T